MSPPPFSNRPSRWKVIHDQEQERRLEEKEAIVVNVVDDEEEAEEEPAEEPEAEEEIKVGVVAAKKKMGKRVARGHSFIALPRASKNSDEEEATMEAAVYKSLLEAMQAEEEISAVYNSLLKYFEESRTYGTRRLDFTSLLTKNTYEKGEGVCKSMLLEAVYKSLLKAIVSKQAAKDITNEISALTHPLVLLDSLVLLLRHALLLLLSMLTNQETLIWVYAQGLHLMIFNNQHI
ncbi:hypothetical protein Tco_0221968 [Tanacetum coccineum]